MQWKLKENGIPDNHVDKLCESLQTAENRDSNVTSVQTSVPEIPRLIDVLLLGNESAPWQVTLRSAECCDTDYHRFPLSLWGDEGGRGVGGVAAEI